MLEDPAPTTLQGEPSDAPTDGAMRERTARENRLVSLLLVARLVTARGDQLCRVRNISSGGLMLETETRIAQGERVRIELRKLQAAEGTVVWTREHRAGVQFLTPVDVPCFLEGGGDTALANHQPRSPRLLTECPVRARVHGRGHAGTLVDISQSGGKMWLDHSLAIGDTLELRIPGLDTRVAWVRWVRNDEVGVSFLDTLSFAELGSWLEDHAIRFAGLKEGWKPL